MSDRPPCLGESNNTPGRDSEISPNPDRSNPTQIKLHPNGGPKRKAQIEKRALFSSSRVRACVRPPSCLASPTSRSQFDPLPCPPDPPRPPAAQFGRRRPDSRVPDRGFALPAAPNPRSAAAAAAAAAMFWRMTGLSAASPVSTLLSRAPSCQPSASALVVCLLMLGGRRQPGSPPGVSSHASYPSGSSYASLRSHCCCLRILSPLCACATAVSLWCQCHTHLCFIMSSVIDSLLLCIGQLAFLKQQI